MSTIDLHDLHGLDARHEQLLKHLPEWAPDVPGVPVELQGRTIVRRQVGYGWREGWDTRTFSHYRVKWDDLRVIRVLTDDPTTLPEATTDQRTPPGKHTSEVVLTDAAGRTWYHNGEDEWAADLGDGVWATLPLRALHRLHGSLTTNEEAR